MYLGSLDFGVPERSANQPPSSGACSWTVVVPFFNERELIEATLASLAAQDMRFTLILVDNGSTDGSGAAAAVACRRLGMPFTLVVEPRPGKVNALAAGVALTRTCFIATCDADTHYPHDYLRQATLLLERGAVAAGAFFVAPGAGTLDRVRAARRIRRAAALLPAQCHTGGAGQVFRTATLRRSGQFDPLRWGYVLEDHEIFHRVARHGAIAYGDAFWCAPTARDRDRASIRWTLVERIAYHLTPARARDWFFYSFLARRLAKRGLTSDRIRETPFQGDAEPGVEERLAA